MDTSALRPKVRKTRRARKLTVGVKQAFVALIAGGYSPTRAAKEVGVSRQAAYKQRSADPDFSAAWGEALEQQADLYEDALRKAAIDQHNIGGIIFGLKNLRSAKWRDRHEVDRRSLNMNVTIPPLPAVSQQQLLAIVQTRLLEKQKLLPAPPDE